MINLRQNQSELIKQALMDTDNYLGVIEEVRSAQFVTKPHLQTFFFHLNRAHTAFDKLGVAPEHTPYMNNLIREIEGYKMYRDIDKFSDFVEDTRWDDEDIDDLVDDLQWEDIYDMYDEDELVYDPNPETDEIEEKITPQNRIKKGLSMRRRSPQLSIARNLKLRRTSSIQVLKKRAVNAARRAVYKKLLMGRDRSSLSPSEKDMIEKRMKNFKYMQATIAIKMLPKLKQIEMSRLANRTSKA